MTYRVIGLSDENHREIVKEYLWRTMKRGTEEQREAIGPRIDGDGDVVYSLLTILTGVEESKTRELQQRVADKLPHGFRTKVAVTMTHEPIPPASPPLAGIDAPEVSHA